MVRKVLYAILMLVFLLYMIKFVQFFPQANKAGMQVTTMKSRVANSYLTNDKKDTGAANVVTAIVVNYRGFDTLGEVTVLFLAMTGLLAVLYGIKIKRDSLTESSLILKAGSRLLFPLIVAYGAYIFIHGHLTPGGGFPGGAVIATGVFLMYAAFKNYSVNRFWSTLTESFSGMAFVIIGIIGIFKGGSFLYNFMPKGTVGQILSAGVIPIIYIFVGFKVASELGALISQMMEGEKE
jgi:multicomponent Na+:H+ antiporter subunit B